MLPKTFTFKISDKNVERLAQIKTEEETKMEVKNDDVRIKHMGINGLPAPVKFRVLPKIDVMMDENGVFSVPPAIAKKILVDKTYQEIVEKAEPQKVPEPPEEIKPAVPEEKPVKRQSKAAPAPSEKAQAEFIKSIVDEK